MPVPFVTLCHSDVAPVLEFAGRVAGNKCRDVLEHVIRTQVAAAMIWGMIWGQAQSDLTANQPKEFMPVPFVILPLCLCRAENVSAGG